MKILAATLLVSIYLLCLAAGWIVMHPPAQQFRDHIEERPSAHFWLGTDALGRDRFARLLYGGRVSLLLAPLCAIASVGIALALASLAVNCGEAIRSGIAVAGDLTLTLPWMFLLLILRGAIPLDASETLTLFATATILAILGWAGPARVLQASLQSLLRAPHVEAARARGVPALRRWRHHILPLLLPLAMAQIALLVPFYLLAEANLGILGLGVAESIPTWGNLLAEVERAVLANGPLEWAAFIPVLALTTVCGCIYFLIPSETNE
ncbi:ABC transporter permease [Bryobacter aggregatus]|uniref:ABC transporter permease n=1 Tax=Bryobacter aggregatus TaxID=360054 RepID=UPI0004E0D38D|nr:ABC transporter permease [Bryobacter aggregatus]